MPRASKLIKITLVGAVPLLVVGMTVRRGIDTRWEQMAARVDAMGVERRSRDADRAAAYGATMEGSAWAQYEVAFERMDEVWEALPVRNFDALEDRTPEGRAKRDLVLRDLEPAFEALHRGAHARDARTGMDLADGSLEGVRSLTRAHYLGRFAIARATALVERGEDMEAVATLLDVQQMGRDLAAASFLIEEMMGLGVLVDPYLLQWLGDESTPQLSKEAKAAWLDGMDRIRATMPATSPAWTGELERFGRDFQRAGEPTEPNVPGLKSAGWRGPSTGPGFAYQFSWRSAAADLMERGPEFAQRADAACQLEPALVLAALSELQAEAAADDNPLVEHFFRSLDSVGKSRIYSMAKFDFLRHALALQLQRQSDVPADPWGHGVRVEVEPDHVRVWTQRGEGTGHLDIKVLGEPQ